MGPRMLELIPDETHLLSHSFVYMAASRTAEHVLYLKLTISLDKMEVFL